MKRGSVLGVVVAVGALSMTLAGFPKAVKEGIAKAVAADRKGRRLLKSRKSETTCT